MMGVVLSNLGLRLGQVLEGQELTEKGIVVYLKRRSTI
jgi:hypothetical protein